MARFSGNLESTLDLRCVYLLVNKLVLISHIKRVGIVFTLIFRQNDQKRESKYSIKMTNCIALYFSCYCSISMCESDDVEVSLAGKFTCVLLHNIIFKIYV